MKNQIIFVSLIIGLTISCHPLAASMITYSDGEFSNDAWTGSIVLQSGPAPSFSAQQMVSGGNPDEFREVRQSYGGFGSIITAHIRTGANHLPSLNGAIDQMTYSFDVILFNGGESGAVSFGAILKQADSIYSAGFTNALTNLWTNRMISGLTATDFSKLSGPGPSNPDFSPTGGLIQFGFFAGNGTGLPSATSTHSGLDNFSVTVSTIPEPGCHLLLLMSLIGPLLVRQNRRLSARISSHRT